MNLNLNDLDLSNISRWPATARVVVILFIMGGVIFLGYWFHIKSAGVLQQAEQKGLTQGYFREEGPAGCEPRGI
jgi:Tfp pilus assembly protein PilO